MSDTYCGKKCEACAERAEIQCPGCRVGPGKAYTGDCGISRCSVQRGYHDCSKCSTYSTCRNRMSSQSMSQKFLRKVKDEKEQKLQKLLNAELLSEKLTILFWLTIASNVASFVFGCLPLDEYPAFKYISLAVSAVMMIAYAVVLLQSASACERYRISGCCKLAVAVLSFIAGLPENQILGALLTIISLVPAVVSEYQEYMGHSEAVKDADSDRAEKWLKLWYWYIGSAAAIVVSLLLMIVAPPLGALAMLAASIVLLVVAIIKIVYIRATANALQGYVYVQDLMEKSKNCT